MKIGPRIIASEVVRSMTDVSDVWKIAAVEQFDAMGNRGWEWLAPIGPDRAAILMGVHGARPTLSAVQGRQKWDGADRWVLYVRWPPGKAA